MASSLRVPPHSVSAWRAPDLNTAEVYTLRFAPERCSTARDWYRLRPRMRAQVVTEIPSLAPALGEIPKPEPLPGELLVRVEACGICGTDLHILAGESYRPDLPFVLGHEGVGVVTAAGSPEDAGWIGQRVTSTLFEGAGGDCDLCRAGTGPCLDGNERLCPTIRSVIGISKRNGAFAEFVAMRAGQAIPVPETLSSPDAAALVDRGRDESPENDAEREARIGTSKSVA